MELSKKYRKLFHKTLIDFNAKLPKGQAEDCYSLFYPMIGNEFKKHREIMFVGRATNNWSAKFKFGDYHKNRVSESVGESHENNRKCPMHWIYEPQYENTYKTKFWKTAKELTRRITNCEDTAWESQLAWSNLYKIAKSWAGNANPSGPERVAQQRNCEALFKMELDELKPKLVLLITDYRNYDCNAKPFLEFLKLTPNRKNYFPNGYIQFADKYHQTKIIVTIRPDNRAKGFSLSNFIEKVLSKC